MSNSPISGLPAATTLTGAELVPIVQGGQTKATPASSFGIGTVNTNFTTPVTILLEAPSNYAMQIKGVPSSPGALQLQSDDGNAYVEAPSSNASSMSMYFNCADSSGLLKTMLLLSAGASFAALGTSVKNCDFRVYGGVARQEGSNKAQGVATLVAGTVTVANTRTKANSRIFLTAQSLGTVTSPKALGVTARVVGTSFTITSADPTDTSVVAWELFDVAP